MINRSELMKRAWRIKRVRNIDFSSALKESWIIEKADNAFMIVDLVACAQQTGKMFFNSWELDFIKSVAYQSQKRNLSEKQSAIVNKLYNRIAA